VLAVHRYSAGLSQRGLARLAGVRQETICRVETGKVRPRARTRAAIAAVLDVDAAVLFGPDRGPDG
jgi:transcriptional regulator with XRE-family HTH domain